MSLKYRKLIGDLRDRAAIRRKATGRKSVEEGKPDRLAKQLEDAADAIQDLLDTTVLTRCTDCGRIRECHSAISVDEKGQFAKPAMVCKDLSDCIDHIDKLYNNKS